MLTQGQCHCNTVKQHGFFVFFWFFSLLLLSVSQLLYCFTNTVLHIPYLPINLSGYIPTCALRCWHLSKIFSNNISQIKLVFKDIFPTLLIVDDIRRHLSVFFQARSFLAFRFVSSSVNIFLSGTRLSGSTSMFCAVTWTDLANRSHLLPVFAYILLAFKPPNFLARLPWCLGMT